MDNNIASLVQELRSYDNEKPWIEFKHNNYDPEMIGRTLSALANSAAIESHDFGYMVWGVHDETHEIVGTDYDLQSLKKGNQELENWLRYLLSNNAEFRYDSCEIEGKTVGVISVRKAIRVPVTFEKAPYIKSGTYTKKLSEFPILEEKLWHVLLTAAYEEIAAKTSLELSEALALINFSAYFDALGIPQPSNYESVSYNLLQDRILIKQDDGKFSITNLGAMLLAKNLSDFGTLSRKALRVVRYEGSSRANILKERVFNEGYVICFKNAIDYIEALIPSKEDLETPLRKTIMPYSMKAIREAVANALIHQQADISGSSLLVEIFDSRIEITNPGTPLVNIKRIVDNPPKSRNEILSSLMHRMKMCEELGSGWDRMVTDSESMFLPAPAINIYEENTKVTLRTKIDFANMSVDDRMWSCYLHACVQYLQDSSLTNLSLRERFNMPETSAASISRLIKAAVEEGLIKLLDSKASPKYRKYVPWWA